MLNTEARGLLSLGPCSLSDLLWSWWYVWQQKWGAQLFQPETSECLTTSVCNDIYWGKGESHIYTFICVFWCFVVLLINLRPRRSSLCTLSLNLSKEDSWCASSWITGKAHPAFSKSSFEERERAEWCGLTYSCDCVVRSVVGGEERPKIIG